MESYKKIIYTSSCTDNHSYIHTIHMRYPNVSVTYDIQSLRNLLASAGSKTITTVFFNALQTSELEAHCSTFFHNDRYIWIPFGSNASIHNMNAIPVYDILDDPQADCIERFLLRLDTNIHYRMKAILLESQMQEIYAIGKTLSAEKDTKVLLNTIMDACMKMTGSDGGTIYIVINGTDEKWSTYKANDMNTKLLKFVIAKNNSMEIDLETGVSPISRESIFGYTVLTGKPLRIEDAYGISDQMDYRFNPKYDQISGYKTQSILTVPMKDHHNQILGVIQLINKMDESRIVPYNAQDEALIYSLAGQAAIALENSLLYQEMEDLLTQYIHQNDKLRQLRKKILRAHEDERARIARDIHDGPAQSMATASMKIEILKKYLQRNMLEPLSAELDELNHSIRLTVQDIRKVIYDLKPSSLETGLINALQNHITIFSETTGIKTNFFYQGSEDLLEDYMCSTLYRIVQESCTNIKKHAQAKSASIFLDIAADKIRLSIIDDGKGFNPQKIKKEGDEKIKGGFGLEGMTERVELLQGTFDIQSEPGRGTHLEIVIPQK